MKKIVLFLTLVVSGVLAYAQTYNNEWIDFSKTYYKFKVGATGLYRIPKTSLTTAGLGTVQAQYFQLWRNGAEIPVYTSVPTGVLGASDYVEFYGQINDGKADTRLYPFDSLQMCDKWSLYTDTAAYFLTVNTASGNKRFSNTLNPVVGNVLPPDPYFMHTLGVYYREALNSGYGMDLGEVVHSASYETAEGWGSSPIPAGHTMPAGNSNLYAYTIGPASAFSATVAGNTLSSRTVSVTLNGNPVASDNVDNYDIKKLTNSSIATATLTGDFANFAFSHDGSSADEIVVSDFQFSYPRQYNFGGQSQFYFELPASVIKYLEISNFNAGSGNPVLLDLTNNLRLTGVVSAGLVKFVLPASLTSRKLVLLSTDAGSANTISSFTQRNFINYGLAANQGDYLVISHPVLFNDGSGIDNVEKYRQYRASIAGGGYNAKTVNIDQLTDQFAFGIKHHPAAIRNFATFAAANFAVYPKYFFMVGKGLNYYEFRNHESDPNINKLALVPTFGFPASDNLLTATRTGEYPTIAIGRLSAITGTEVGYYLDKIKQFELAQLSSSQTIAGKGWMKNIAQLTGGLSDQGLYGLISSYMQSYEQIASDSLFGGKVYQFSKNSGLNTALGSNKTIENLFNEGLTMLNYFGHSSPNTIEFNLDNPENYTNTGKYPLIIVNGCNSGDLFMFDTLRAVSKGSLSEKFVFANQKGSIGYIASTHFGLPTELNYVNTDFYYNMCKNMYGESLGNIMKATMHDVYDNYSTDYIAQTHVEEITLHGDPAIRMNPHTKPDYAIQDSLISFNPSVISVADTKLTITSRIINIGRAIKDSITIRVQQKLPDNSIVTLGNYRIKAVIYEDSITTILNINPLIHKGLNQIIVTVDPDNLLSELSKTNNTVTKDFTVIEDEIRPVWPYEYAIVHAQNTALYASTANPTANVKHYIMELDTTALFNSSLKVTKTVTDSGGVIKFVPGITFTDSTVYYWRVTIGPVNSASRWLKSSFVYINAGSDGYNQSHYYQYKNDDFDGITIDSNTRKFGFTDKTRKLLIRTGLYPYYLYDQININVDNDQLDYYGCNYRALQIVVYDPLTLVPWKNYDLGGVGRFGSRPACTQPGGYRNFFEYPYFDSSYRRKAIQFFDSIPNGYYVSITNLGTIYGTADFIDQWKADTAYLGHGKSLWHKFHELGLHKIDSFSKNLPFLFVFRKGDSLNFPIKQTIGTTDNTHIAESYDIGGKQIDGTVTTPWYGPVNQWFRFKWNQTNDPVQASEKRFTLTGRDNSGNETDLADIYNSKDTTIAFVDATVYPYLKVKMYNKDEQNAKTLQLKHWMLTATQVPEGGIAPNMTFRFQDTLTLDDTLHFKVSFRNTSSIDFDSVKIRLTIKDQDGADHVYNNLGVGGRVKPLAPYDSVIISADIPMGSYIGQNQFVLEINPDDDQPEQFHFNNYLYRSFLVTNPGICPGGTASFTAGAISAGDTYQWQVNTGSGYINIGNNAVYSGTTRDTLTLVNAPTSMYGYKYRCAVTRNSLVTYTAENPLKFALYWNGNAGTAWENPLNWSCNTLPDGKTDVIVNPGLANYPIIKSSALCRSIRLKQGTSVRVNTGFTLNIQGLPGN